MFEEILNCAGFLFLLTLTVCSTETKQQYFPQVRPTKDRIYFACVITLPPFPFFTVGIKQEGGAACVVC